MSKTCLIVDDSRVVRSVATKIMTELGFSHREAADGQEAVLACESAMPDIILLDWNMPVMDGLAFVKQLRGMAGGDTPVVIFCTTVNELPRIQEAIQAGANEYIMKPFDGEIVKNKLEQLNLL